MHNDRLLKNEEFIRSVEVVLKATKKDVILISAFLRSEVLQWISDVVSDDVKVIVLTRWKPTDLLCGASDLAAFQVAKENFWDFYIDTDLHAKALLCDESRLFIGSANFTSRGTHLFGKGNNELNIAVDASYEEVEKIKSYLLHAHRLLQPMWDYMSNFIEDIQVESSDAKNCSWPQELLDCIDPIVDSLWLEECIRLTPEEYYSQNADTKDIQHTFELLGSYESSNESFCNTRLAKWLKNILMSSGSNMRFGEISACLHDSLINDPKPYRREVKEYVDILFQWIGYYDIYLLEKYTRTVSIVNPYVRYS